MLLNFREVAGLPGHEGRRIRPGMIFRGGAVTDPTAALLMCDRRIATVYDLRNRHEEARRPSALRGLGLRHPVRQHEIDLAAPIRMLRDGAGNAMDNRATMLRIYRELPHLFQPTFQAVFADLLASDGPIYIHCAVGKDRTGVMVALLLSALGVGREAIEGDYLRSNDAYGDIAASFQLRHPQVAATDNPALRPFIHVETDYLDVFLNSIQTPDSYLRRQIGLDEAALATLRQRFLD